MAGVVIGALVGGGVGGGIVAATTSDSTQTVTVPRADNVTLDGDPTDIQGILTRIGPAVVTIHTEASRGFTGFVQEGAGSGFVLREDGLVVTNAHVVAGATGITVTLSDGTEERALVLGADEERDLAVLKIDADGLPVAALGDSGSLRVGDDVVAIGNALGLSGDPTVTRGIVSAKDREIDTNAGTTLRDIIQTDAAINPGNSGGPLVNAKGQVVGINTAVAGGADNIGFAIAISAALPRIEELAQGEVPNRAFLGVSTLDAADARAEGLEIDVDQGAFVVAVTPGSAADQAGITEGDVIVDVEGQAITTSEELGAAIGRFAPGETITVVVDRDGERRSLTTTLVNRFDF